MVRKEMLEPDQNHRTQDRDEHRVEKSAGACEADRAHDEAANERAEDSDHDVRERAVAASLQNFPRRPAGDESHADPPDHDASRARMKPLRLLCGPTTARRKEFPATSHMSRTRGRPVVT